MEETHPRKTRERTGCHGRTCRRPSCRTFHARPSSSPRLGPVVHDAPCRIPKQPYSGQDPDVGGLSRNQPLLQPSAFEGVKEAIAMRARFAGKASPGPGWSARAGPITQQGCHGSRNGPGRAGRLEGQGHESRDAVTARRWSVRSCRDRGVLAMDAREIAHARVLGARVGDMKGRFPPTPDGAVRAPPAHWPNRWGVML